MKENAFFQKIFSCSSLNHLERTLLLEEDQQVHFYQGESTKCLQLENEFFHRRLETKEWIDLAGSPPNGLVFIGCLNNEIVLDVVEPIQLGLVSSFHIFKNKQKCHLSIDHYQILRHNCQNQGIGTECFHRQLKKSLELNFSQILTKTSRKSEENGYYTWPRFGFNAKLPSKIIRLLPTTINHSKTLLHLMETETGRLWWRNHGVGLKLTFDLSPESDSLRCFEKYYFSKKNSFGQNEMRLC